MCGLFNETLNFSSVLAASGSVDSMRTIFCAKILIFASEPVSLCAIKQKMMLTNFSRTELQRRLWYA